MSIFSVLSLLGGLAIFLFGMNVMGDGLERSSAGKLKSILENLTSNPLKSVLLGAGVTAIIQSSSATTVMVVGFVNSGIMQLSQSIGIIMGANIGTTVTAWLLSLVGLESDNFFITLLKPSNLSLIMAVAGIILYMFSKNHKKKDIGTIFLGFAILITGMDMMSAAVQPLADVPEFANILLLFSNPILGILMGALLTGIIQSSSASVGILQALATTGSVRFSSAVPIILGQNIGTCVTAILSSIGANKNARRAAVVHLCFNIIGALAFSVLFYGARLFVNFSFIDSRITPAQIAIVHTTFNVFSTLIMLPFGKQLEKLAYLVIRDKQTQEETQPLDERLLAAPAVAIGECTRVTNKMAQLAKDMLFKAMNLLDQYSDKDAEEIQESEKMIDSYEDMLGSYLVKVSQESLTNEDSREVSLLLHSLGDFERIGDHACNLLSTADEIRTKKISFSDAAKKEVQVESAAIREIVENTFQAFLTRDRALAKKTEPLEQVIDGINRELKTRHVERLKNNQCTIEMGFVFSDLLTNYERIADHCSNIAASMLQMDKNSLETHAYLDEVKYHGKNHFDELYQNYQKKYTV